MRLVRQNFFEIDLSLYPKFTQPDAYAGALPAAFKAIGYPLCKRHNHSLLKRHPHHPTIAVGGKAFPHDG
jgi:hypothetical protein